LGKFLSEFILFIIGRLSYLQCCIIIELNIASAVKYKTKGMSTAGLQSKPLERGQYWLISGFYRGVNEIFAVQEDFLNLGVWFDMLLRNI
jgi:hypothetical protein